MRRRQFIAGLGSAVAWPVVARAQQPALPVLGFLDGGSPRPDASDVVAFRQGLAAAGFVEGRTVAIEYRWANRQGGRLAPLAAELVQRKVAVIVAIDSGPTVLAAQAATSTIPIVFAFAGDPIEFGLVASLSRPGGNMTGVTFLSSELTGKRLGLLLEMAPLATTGAYLTNPLVRDSEAQTRDMLAAVRALGRQAIILEARDQAATRSLLASARQAALRIEEAEIDAAFATPRVLRLRTIRVGPVWCEGLLYPTTGVGFRRRGERELPQTSPRPATC
jgi:putative ABC transport system substrate-binding protein